MKRSEVSNLKKALGKAFTSFFPHLEKKTIKIVETLPQENLVLVSMFEGKQTQTIATVRTITGWTIKKTTDFVKQGKFPKVIEYNIRTLDDSIVQIIDSAKVSGICVIEIQ